MMRRITKGFIVIALLLVQMESSFAQQNSMFSQYMFNTLAINPAYAGSRNVVSATALYRNQWVGIEGAPRTGTFTADAPFAGERVGLGLQIISDVIGITRTAEAVVSGAFRIPLNMGSLSFGIQGSASQFHAGFSDVDLGNGGTAGDAAFRSDVNKVFYNLGSGVYYNTERMYAGLAVLDFVQNRINDTIGLSQGTSVRQAAHGYMAAGYVFPVGYDFNLKTSMLLKGVKGAPIQADVNATLWIKEMIAFGAEYRTSADISALMEVRVTPQVRIGYAYDKSITSLRSFNSGSHEFMLRYEFSFDRNSLLSPRFF